MPQPLALICIISIVSKLSGFNQNQVHVCTLSRHISFAAEWPAKPPHFLAAGTLHHSAKRATRSFNIPPGRHESSKITPSQKSISSSTRGLRNELISPFGSLGPGIIPTIITLLSLNLSSRGRFISTRYITPQL